MEIKKPLLSLCIPTYNRAVYLKKSLDSLVRQERFSEIEVVISDNASDDGTRELCKKYCKKYSNIKYFENEKIFMALNQVAVMQKANGILRKLCNDTIVYKSGAIKYMLEMVEKYQDKKPVLFFENGKKKPKARKNVIRKDVWKTSEFYDLDSFLYRVSYGITWIATIALWEEDCECMEICQRYMDSCLPYVPYLMQLFEKRGGAAVLEQKIMEVQTVDIKNLSYGLHKVFYQNFLGFFKSYVKEGKISQETYQYIREDLLCGFFTLWIVQFEQCPEKYKTSGENLRALVEKEYQNDKYFGYYKKLLFKERVKLYFRPMIYPLYKRWKKVVKTYGK